jgi:hypothetical protein
MKKFLTIITLYFSITGGAQTQSLQQLQLDIEKLAQLKMMLSNMYSGYNMLISSYNNIKDQSLANFNLHKNFLDGLLTISPAVRNDPAINEIFSIQAQIISAYNDTYQKINRTGVFNAGELDYFNKGYAKINKQTDQNLADLQLLIAPDKLQMNEAERLSAIQRIHTDMETQLSAIRSFTKKVNTLSAMRLQMKKENETIRNSFGIQK